MRFFSWLRAKIGSRQRRAQAGPKPRVRLWLEALEDRRVPSTLPVTSAVDDASQHGSLRYALAHAHDGDTILLTGAVAKTGITLTQGELILTQQNLTIVGAGDDRPAKISGGQQARVFEVAPGASVTLRNLTITDGAGTTGDPADPHEGRGGGIVVDENAVLTITGCTVSHNSTELLGGGIADYGTLTVRDCTLSDNHVMVRYGGAIAVFSGAPFSTPFSATMTITGSTVSDNTAHENGAGITGVASTVTLNNCRVIGNSTDLYDGAGLNNHGGTMTVNHSIVAGNTAGNFGGGIQNFIGSTLTLNDCDVCGNSASGAGGIDNYGALTLVDSRLSNNSTRKFGAGGAIFNEYGGTVSVKDSLLSMNTADYGGGIYSFGDITICDTDLSRNTGRIVAGAIVNYFATVAVIHSVLSDNSSANGGAIVNVGAMTIGNSRISHNTASVVGGGILNFGDLTIDDSDISHNFGGNGGGIATFASLTITNSTLSHNSADRGGGIYSFFSTDTLSGCKITNNVAADQGGGIFASYDTLTISDASVISGNAATAGGGLYVETSNATVTVASFSRITGNIAPAGAGGDVYIQAKLYDFDPDAVLYLEDHSRIGDVYNGGVLYRDSTSKIHHLDDGSNSVIPL
ncbi:MAG: right-handed parallel beta-helix repeat-containing protein [Gemmataceae bacterium]